MGEGAKIKKAVAAKKAYTKPSMQSRTDIEKLRQKKSDTESGMTPEQKRAVNSIEEEYRDRHTETGFIVGENGRILTKTIKSRSNQATFDLGLVRMYGNDAVITHNHPNHEFDSNGKYTGDGSGLGQRVGVSLSGEDIALAAYADAKEMRASSPNYTYSIRRGENGWCASPRELHSAWEREYERQMFSLELHAESARNTTIKQTDGTSKTYSGEDIRKERWGRMNALASHRAIQDVAKKYGLVYTRRKVHDISPSDAKHRANGMASREAQQKLREERAKKRIEKRLSKLDKYIEEIRKRRGQ